MPVAAPLVGVQLPKGILFFFFHLKREKKKKEDFLVSNPVVSAFPMGSVNHFLLADRNNFSFRNGTFMFCGFSVYTHFATLCQHLLMNKYITRLTENEVLAEADWMFKPC